MRKIITAIIATAISSAAIANPAFYRLDGTITHVVDRTTEQSISAQAVVGQPIFYVFMVDSSRPAIFFDKGAQKTKSATKTENNVFAELLCGSQLSSGYLGKIYYIASDEKTPRKPQLTLQLHQLLTLKAPSNLERLAVGHPFAAELLMAPNGGAPSKIQAKMTITSIQDSVGKLCR
jgi:hypothetical protein